MSALSEARSVLLPGATLGVMGGGQLGRMFVHAAQSLGYFTAVLDADPVSPAGLVAQYHVQTGYQDEQGLAQLMQRCQAITTEFENVPAGALRTLGAQRPVAPSGDAVAVCQDRALEKAHFVRCGVPCAPHALIEDEAGLAAIDAAALLPGILKTARLGYDGKGQVRVRSADELAAAWRDLGGVACVLERMLPLALELSVVVARNAHGEVVTLPVQQNLHRDGILAVTQVPAPDATPAQSAQAVACAARIAAELGYVGVLCVEFFVLADGTLVANEMAPRPHNSGHWSIDGADISQFELQVRTLTGLPLIAPRQHSPSVMLNLLGDLWFDAAGQLREPDWAGVLALPGVHLHLYGKTDARVGRKMGHLTVTAATAEQAREVALQVCARLGLAAC
ncbi:5-(carboxyamino)imidazole ribonucleotide synthase [Pseudaquabacterium rugosum]|jgi:5-(carboxyamino)imidazole ribonucleotide synthase|uniref:N5-carboxyaminoimidazole ribonucleotide synthase n=1 Tax=Pseudaquabacterium rugosum TaxID=2984194 RepID=A0ABU9B401_9BURK